MNGIGQRAFISPLSGMFQARCHVPVTEQSGFPHKGVPADHSPAHANGYNCNSVTTAASPQNMYTGNWILFLRSTGMKYIITMLMKNG